MRHTTSRDTASMFDHETDAADDLTSEFWGTGAGWTANDSRNDRSHQRAMQVRPTDDDRTEYRLDHAPTSMRAVRDGIKAFKPKRRWRDDSTGPVERTRQHGVVRADTPPPTPDRQTTSRRPAADTLAHSGATIADLAAGKYDGSDDDYYDLIPATPRRNVAVEPARRRTTTDERSARSHLLAARSDSSADECDEDLIALTPATPGDRRGRGHGVDRGDDRGRRVGLDDVDPAVVRIGIVLLAVVLAIPLALAMRSTDDSSGPATPFETVPAAEQVVTQSGAEPAAEPLAAESADGPSESPTSGAAEPAAEASSPTPEPAASAGAPGTDAAADGATEAAAPSGAERTAQGDDSIDSSASSAGADEAVAVVDAPAERITPDCSLTYTAAAGDSWYRIADGAGVTPGELLDQNMASLDSVILPGDEICLPAGATVPSPPAAAAPTTTAPTTDEAPSTTAAPTTQTPTTTAAPTTTVATITSYSTAEVQALIRETWPEEQHEKALQVAWRESNYIATADNGWCCVGVFQMYWTVHQGWLDDYGIYTRNDLKDARKNITAAYALYQSSGGWGPWGG